MAIRRIGEPVRKDRRYRLRPGVYAILPGSEGLLLTFQSEPKPEIQLPGGGIDPGEHPIPALHREVFEETGWRIAAPRRIGAFRRFTYMPEYTTWAEKICHIFIARPTRQISQPTESHHMALWSSPDEAVGLLENAGDRLFLARFLASTAS